MEHKEILSLIKKYSLRQNRTYEGSKIVSAKVRCHGCGKWISTDDISDIGCTVTRRKTAVFFHNKCGGKVWSSKIPLEN